MDPATQESFVDGKAYYYPGVNVTQGGVRSWRTNPFVLDCREAEAMPVGFVPPRFMTPDRLIILTDGTCGSTCASFTKIAQEASKATFVGAGGLWGQPMDVSSFAGGFVCNPGYLQNIANKSGVSFPRFLTNQGWQFGWATWYSARFPSRAVQFTAQEPDLRVPFWAFPHSSVNSTVTSEKVSVLYDSLISDAVARLQVDKDTCEGDDVPKVFMISTLILSVVVAFLIAVVCMQRRSLASAASGDYSAPYLNDDMLVQNH